MGYELLDGELTKSTLWMFGSKDAKILFITILAECRGSDICRTPVTVLVRLAGLTESEGQTALDELGSPDPESKYQGHDGRRVIRVQDEIGKGLHIPSYKSRRNRYLSKDRMAQMRQRESEQKERAVEDNADALRSITGRYARFDLEAEAEAEVDIKSRSKGSSRRSAPPPKTFLEFWDIYPKRVKRLETIKKWSRLSQEDRALALAGAKEYRAAHDAGTSEGRRFTANPDTWLNQGRWTDDRAAWAQTFSGNLAQPKPQPKRVTEADLRASAKWDPAWDAKVEEPL